MTTTLMVLDKDDLMGGTQATPSYHHVVEDSTTGHQVWGHAIAVEYDAWNNSDPVYTVASGQKPHFPNAQHQDTIYVGAIVPNGSIWGYIAHPITGVDLPEWFDNETSAATPGGNVTLIARSFLHATYRPDSQVGGRILTCHHIRDTTGGTNPQPVGGYYIRWYEIHTNGWPNTSNVPTIASYGDIKFENLETYDPSIAVNAAGHIALTWTQSGPNLYPEFWMGVQRSFDPPGVLGYTRRIQTSSTIRAVGIGHKADYSGIDPDPEDPCRFWGHSMLAPSTSEWDTHVGVLCVPDCDADSYADQDANQEYDAFDLLIYSERFRAGDPRADCNGDRVLNVLDYLCFNSLFSAGGRR